MAATISAARRCLARIFGPHLAVLAVAATALIWGTSSVATKVALVRLSEARPARERTLALK
jgi:hypothetical protein